MRLMAAEIRLRQARNIFFTIVAVSFLIVKLYFHFMTPVMSFYICNQKDLHLMLIDIHLLQGIQNDGVAAHM